MKYAGSCAAILMLTLSACEATPQLARGLSEDNTYAAFNQRLNARFPLGSPSASLVAELEHEHFTINTFNEEVAEQRRNDPQFAQVAEQSIRGSLGSYDFYARRSALQGVCENAWSIYYSVKEGEITALHGDLRLGGCP